MTSKLMLIQDRIYGTFEIDGPVIEELINSKPLQRLKGISQFGVPEEFYHLKGFSRYEHCMGVMLLLRMLGASEEEQIAGLLHDASHAAFSHLYDWVLQSRGKEDHQDSVHFEKLSKTELPAILKKYNYTLEQVCDYHRFGLLERDAPELCADRVDYGLREFPEIATSDFISHIIAQDNRMMFSDRESARLFGFNFLDRQKNHWNGSKYCNSYHYFAEALRRAIELGAVAHEDFDRDDEFVTSKLLACQDERIQHILKVLRSDSFSTLPLSDEIIHKKFRYVDPTFLSDGKPVRLSEADEEYKTALEQARTKNRNGPHLVVI